MTKPTLIDIAPGVQAVTNDATQPVTSNVRAYPLDHVHQNPWQTRLAEDPAHIQALADSIAAKSMLQIPLARPYPGKPGHVQLAFGHSRLAAYKLLADPIVVVEDKERFFHFPVDVRELSDREMSDLAAEENAKRHDLTAIEKATAIQRRIKDFGLSQEEAGAPFGLKTQGAVSNLLGLLKLPEELRESVATGEIPQRLARQAVIVGQLFPKEVTAAMREAAKAPMHEREQATHDALSQILDRKGRNIQDAAFEPDWPRNSISLNGQSVGDLTVLPPCRGCEFFYKRDDEMFCLRPACYDLKHERALEEKLKKASLKTGVPMLLEGEKAVPIFDSFYWSESQQMKKLLSGHKRDATLGLRVMPKPERLYGHYDEVTGSNHVIVATVNKVACEKFLKEAERKKDKPKPKETKGSFNLPKLSPAQATAQAAAEEAAKEERRQERSAKYRLEADVVWIVKNFTEVAAEQITISGSVLGYVVERLLRSNRQKASEFYGLLDWYDELESIAKSTDKNADRVRRQMLVASQVFEHSLPWNGTAHDCWDEVVEGLTNLGAVENDGEPGFGIKLPAGWNKPPIHHTDHNCWFCGKFASSRTLTKRDIEAGWWVAPAKAKDAIPPVACPDCATDAIKTLDGHKATKKGK